MNSNYSSCGDICLSASIQIWSKHDGAVGVKTQFGVYPATHFSHEGDSRNIQTRTGTDTYFKT